MLDALIDTLELFPRGLVYVGLSIIIIGIARVVQGIVTPYSISEQLNTHNNVALFSSTSMSHHPVYSPDRARLSANAHMPSSRTRLILAPMLYAKHVGVRRKIR